MEDPATFVSVGPMDSIADVRFSEGLVPTSTTFETLRPVRSDAASTESASQGVSRIGDSYIRARDNDAASCLYSSPTEYMLSHTRTALSVPVENQKYIPMLAAVP